jgi:hypothetical protein
MPDSRFSGPEVLDCDRHAMEWAEIVTTCGCIVSHSSTVPCRFFGYRNKRVQLIDRLNTVKN